MVYSIREITLVLDRAIDLWETTWHLLRIGYELPLGWLAGSMRAWRIAGHELAFIPQWTVTDLNDRMKADRDLVVLDVRQPAEWQSGHVPGARYISGAELLQRVDEVPTDRPVAVYCGSGYRSSVASSVLKQSGHQQVFNVLGGFTAWKNRDLPIER